EPTGPRLGSSHVVSLDSLGLTMSAITRIQRMEIHFSAFVEPRSLRARSSVAKLFVAFHPQIPAMVLHGVANRKFAIPTLRRNLSEQVGYPSIVPERRHKPESSFTQDVVVRNRLFAYHGKTSAEIVIQLRAFVVLHRSLRKDHAGGCEIDMIPDAKGI